MSARTPVPPAIAQRRVLHTAIPGPRSLALAERRTHAVGSGLNCAMPVYADHAGGGIVVDVDGNHLIDLGSGIAVTTVGADHPRVVDAIQAQAARFTHTCSMVTPYESYIAVAEHLNRVTPGDHDKRTVLFTTGSEAVENAVKVARAFTGRTGIAVFDHAYHGRTNLTLSMTARATPFKRGFGPYAADIYRAPMSYPFRDGGLSGPQAAARAIDVLERQAGADSLAALVIEPIQGEGGFIEPAPGFLPTLAQWCTDHGVVFVADEVQSGLARTGDYFASMYEGVVPDMVVTAKGLAGGMPLAAVTARRDLMEAVQPGGLGGTYGGNPLACAAALAVFEVIDDEALVDRARHIGHLLYDELNSLRSHDSRVGDLRGRGAMTAIELVKPGSTAPDSDLARAVVAAAHREGVVVLTAGAYGNVLRFLPPLTISDDLLVEGLQVVRAALAAL